MEQIDKVYDYHDYGKHETVIPIVKLDVQLICAMYPGLWFQVTRILGTSNVQFTFRIVDLNQYKTIEQMKVAYAEWVCLRSAFDMTTACQKFPSRSFKVHMCDDENTCVWLTTDSVLT